MKKQGMKAVAVAVVAIVFSATHPVQAEVVFQDGFESPSVALQNDINTNYVVRQAAGTTNSIYTKSGSPASQAALQKNEHTFGSDLLLGRTHPNTNSQYIAVDLDTDFGSSLAGRQWSLSFKGMVAASLAYDGWTSFAVGNPANGPNGAQNGFGFYIRGSTGSYVAWNRGSIVGSGGIGTINGQLYTLTADFDEGAGTVALTFDSATTNINMGTFTTDFADSSRFVELENFVQGSTNFDGTGLVDMRWDDLTIESIGGAPQPTVEESFDYSVGSAFNGLAGGTGWGNNVWTAPATVSVVADSLTYPGITSVGNKMYADGTGDSRSYRNMEYGFGHGTVYVSMLCQRLNETQRYFGLSLYSGGTEQMLLGQGSGFSDWTINHLATNDLDLIEAPGEEGLLSNGALDSGILSTNLSLLLVKIDFDASSMDSRFENVTFWVNPDLSQAENIADAVGGQSYSTDRDFGTINRARVGGGAYSATYGDPAEEYTDEIRFSTNSPFASTPTIGSSVSGGNVTFSWPSTTLGWKLQHTTNLISGTWTDVTNSDTTTSTNLPASLSSEFFRLINP